MDQLTLWFCSRQETEELFNSLSMSEQGSWRSSSRARHFHYKSSHQVFSDKTFPSIPVFFPVLRENTYCFTDKKHGPKCWLTLKESIQCPLFLSVFVCYPGKILDPWTEFMELWVRQRCDVMSRIPLYYEIVSISQFSYKCVGSFVFQMFTDLWLGSIGKQWIMNLLCFLCVANSNLL